MRNIQELGVSIRVKMDLPFTPYPDDGTRVIPNVLEISLNKNRKMADVPNSFPMF